MKKKKLNIKPVSIALVAVFGMAGAVSVPVLAETLAKPIVIAKTTNPCNPCAAKNPCNPCAAKNPCNPCAAKNPCNPCAAKNPCKPCAAKNPCNPCAAKNPCNPCAAKNPCNPCAAKNPCNPCAAKNPCNPCGANPCAAKIKAADITRPAGTKAYAGDKNELLAYGTKLWEDKSLSASGALSCATCHAGYNTLSKSFELPYPHKIAMVKAQIGADLMVDAEQIVQFCMMSPMQAKPLAWDSKELAALSTFVIEFQKGFKAK